MNIFYSIQQAFQLLVSQGFFVGVLKKVWSYVFIAVGLFFGIAFLFIIGLGLALSEESGGATFLILFLVCLLPALAAIGFFVVRFYGTIFLFTMQQYEQRSRLLPTIQTTTMNPRATVILLIICLCVQAILGFIVFTTFDINTFTEASSFSNQGYTEAIKSPLYIFLQDYYIAALTTAGVVWFVFPFFGLPDEVKNELRNRSFHWLQAREAAQGVLFLLLFSAAPAFLGYSLTHTGYIFGRFPFMPVGLIFCTAILLFGMIHAVHVRRQMGVVLDGGNGPAMEVIPPPNSPTV